MQNPSDEIKSKLDIVDVIREYIQLKAAGLNFRSNCPFHREKTPSFMVSPEKQIWHCFGCGKGGDVIAFVMEMEGLSFIEALRQLAPKAGVTLKKVDPSLTSQRNRLLDIVELSRRYYHKVLTDSRQAEWARKYLAERKLSDNTISDWQIGYSPESWDALTTFLKSRGFGENEIFLAGMSVRKESGRGFYDRFRDRIMFPINDINGNTVGFSARINPVKEKTEKMGKYINSPQSMIYDKSRILFGLDKAKMAIKAEDAAIIVEGQMDVITAHQGGFKNVVASSGTSLTAEQVALLKRYSPNVLLSFDMDKAGDLASERGIAQAMQAEMNIKVIEIPSGKDPDECIKNNPEEWKLATANAKPVMQYYFDKTFVRFNIKEYENKNKAIKILLPVIGKLGSKIEQDFWIKRLSQVTDTGEGMLYESFAKINKPAKAVDAVAPAAKNVLAKQSREEMLTELLLALILRFPSHIEYVINNIRPEQFSGEPNQDIYKNLIIYYNKVIDYLPTEAEWTPQTPDFTGEPNLGRQGGIAINYDDFKNWLSYDSGGNDQPNAAAPSGRLDRLVLLADKDFYDFTPEQAKAEIISIIASLKKGYLAERMKVVSRLIGETEREEKDKEIKDEKLKLLLEEFKTLTEEIREIENK